MVQSNIATQPVATNPYPLEDTASNLEWIVALLALPIAGVLISTIYLQVFRNTGQVSGVHHTQQTR